MHLETWADISLIFFGGLFSIIAVSLLGVMAFALTKLVKLLDTITNKLDPVIVKATDTIETVQRVTASVGEKADHILSRGEMMTDSVSDRVEKTAGVVQQAVTGPLINLSSLISGVTKGVEVYTHPSGNGKKQ